MPSSVMHHRLHHVTFLEFLSFLSSIGMQLVGQVVIGDRFHMSHMILSGILIIVIFKIKLLFISLNIYLE